MHGRCLERRKAAQSKKGTEEIGRVSRFFPSRATSHVPLDPENPHLRSIDLLALVVDPPSFAVCDHRPPWGHEFVWCNILQTNKKMIGSIRDKRKMTILELWLMIIHARQIKSECTFEFDNQVCTCPDCPFPLSNDVPGILLKMTSVSRALMKTVSCDWFRKQEKWHLIAASPLPMINRAEYRSIVGKVARIGKKGERNASFPGFFLMR